MHYVSDICCVCVIVKCPTLADLCNGGELGVSMRTIGPVAEGKRALSELISPDEIARAQKLSTACFMANFKGC